MKAAARVDQNIERPPILRGMVVWQTALPFMAYTIGVLPRRSTTYPAYSACAYIDMHRCQGEKLVFFSIKNEID